MGHIDGSDAVAVKLQQSSTLVDPPHKIDDNTINSTIHQDRVGK
jgi:hypothetical protein